MTNKITPEMILGQDKKFIYLYTPIRETCTVCDQTLYENSYPTLDKKDLVKIGDDYYLIHIENKCKELFLLTPQLYVY